MNIKKKEIKIFIKIIIISAIAFFCVYVFYLPYNEIKLEMIKALHSEQKVLARQAADGIESFFEHYSNSLNYMSKSTGIILMDSRGESRMKGFYESHFNEVKAITRVDSKGRILYTYPYNRNSMGADVSSQGHNRAIMENHRPVVSDVFLAVQGYHAVAYSYPVFRERQYDGCVTVLISFGHLAAKHLSGIKIKNRGHAWMLSRSGVEIFSPYDDHMGKIVYQTYAEFPSVISLADEMLKGREGTAVIYYNAGKNGKENPVKSHAYYLPVQLPGTFWSIAVETPEPDVLSAMESFKNKWLFIMFFFSAGIIIYIRYFIKARTILKEEEKRLTAEAQLRASERKYSELAESLPLSVFEFDLQGKFTYVNRTALEEFKYSREDIERGLNVFDVMVPEDRERAMNSIIKLYKGDLIVRDEYTALRSDGSTFPFIVNMEKVLDDDRPVGMRGVVINISDRKRLEAELLKAQKLESIGILAGGIAHDFNNLLMVIFGNVSLIKLNMEPLEMEKERIESIEKAAIQAADLTKQLLTFSKGGKAVKELVNLNEIIQDSLKFALSGTNVSYDYAIDDNVWAVAADAGQMKQVFNNLIINACQSMPNGGKIIIRIANVADVPDGEPSGLGRKKVRITVRDQGVGIPEGNIHKIFDPYFTTKEKGSGLGLAVTYSIIKNHDGQIMVESEPGKGTTFTITLPAYDKEKIQRKKTGGEVIRGQGSILLMDDDTMIRNVTADMLIDLGYTAELARDGSEAVEKFRNAYESGSPFDAVIMDITIIGGMGGKDAVKELLKIDGNVKTIATSGYTSDPILSDYELYGFVKFIAKPYNLPDLGKVIHEVLGK